MELPPGIAYLQHLLPYFALPSVVTYGFLHLLRSHVAFSLPSWFIISISILSRPILLLIQTKYLIWSERKAAAAQGATLAPFIEESPFDIMSDFVSAFDGYPGDLMLHWSKAYGNSVQFRFLTSTTLSTVEPEHVKAILSSQFEAFEKGPLLISQIGSLLGKGVFNSDGELWKFHRAITRPFFTRERISDFQIYERNCELSFAEARKRLSEGFPIDFQDLTARFTLDSSSAFLFGSSVESLSAGIPYPPLGTKKNPPSFNNHPSTKFVSAFAEGLALAASRLGRGREWPLAEFFKDEIKPFRKVMDDYTEPLLRNALDKRDKELAENKAYTDTDEDTLLAHLVKQTQDLGTLKDELVNLLVAGRDSVMCLLSYSLYMLSEHPDVEKRLREEIFDIVGPTGIPTYDHMREMKYMRAFLNEVLRLYPPVPLNFRTNKRPVILPAVYEGQKPLYVPANTSCMYTVINIHRRVDLWGPDALVFDPDRFLDQRLHRYLTPNPYIFCPFNAGPRICLGQQFAYNEASFYLVRLLQQFTDFTLDASTNTPPPIEWASGEGRKSREKIRPLSHLTMSIKGGLWIRMKELNE